MVPLVTTEVCWVWAHLTGAGPFERP